MTIAARLLEVIDRDILPLTESAVAKGNKVFGAAILRKVDLSLVIAGTNEETVNLAIKAYEVSEGSTPSMAQLIAGTDPYLDEVPGDWTVAGGVASSTECNLP